MKLSEWIRAVQPAAKRVHWLADELGVSTACVKHWANGVRQVNPRLCRRIEQITDGVVTAVELRPDVFGEPDAAA